ncbi:MAG: hypothetical protein ACI4TU_01070 [Candidatus Cryptobacteroides sp.]
MKKLDISEAIASIPMLDDIGNGDYIVAISGGIAGRIKANRALISDAKDLSLYDIYGNPMGSRETANCYVISKAGKYRFPIIYGNAIKGDQANEAAYKSFVNYLGNEISSPYIEDDTQRRAECAELVWQDEESLVTNIEITDAFDGRYVQFSIDTVPDVNGNALIAIKDSNGVIMWSWHIWVTNDDLSSVSITNSTPKTYDIMPLNLGWKWDDTSKQRGKNMHYQFGRKDPFPCPSKYNSSSEIAIYGKHAIIKENSETNNTTIIDSIKRPYSFFFGTEAISYKWEPSGRLDLWCARNESTGISDQVIVKTIYDPCPAGWSVPNARIFTGFTTAGGNSSNKDEFNVVGSFDAGWMFKKNSGDAVGTFFPASGYRSRDSGELANVGGNGYYWSAIPYSSADGRYLYFYSGYVSPQNASYRACGFSVRPARELY